MKKHDLYSLNLSAIVNASEMLSEGDQLHIHLISTSPNGITNVMGYYDLLKLQPFDIHVHAYGQISLEGLLILSVAPVERRYFHDNAYVFVSDKAQYMGGTVDEAAVAQESYSRMVTRFYTKVAETFDGSLEEVLMWVESDKTFIKEDLIMMGFIDDDVVIPSFTEGSVAEMPANRNIVLEGDVTIGMATGFIGLIRAYERANPNEPIYVYVNSPGGLVDAMFAMMDARDNCKCPMFVVVVGQAASAAALFSATFKQGYRAMTEHSEFMFHMPRGVWVLGHDNGRAKTSQEYGQTIKRKQEEHLAKITGFSIEEIVEQTRVEKFLNSEESKAFKVVDNILKVDE